MKATRTFTVSAAIPERLRALERIARNLFFVWYPEAISLFQRIDPDIWVESGHNPVILLGRVSKERLDEMAGNEGFLAQMDEVEGKLDEYLSEAPSYAFRLDKPADFQIAYLSAEYGLSESLPVYSGGLGVLSGDHLKSASDLRIPLIGVGLMYNQGYFRQYLNSDGWQQERYPTNDLFNMPATLVKDEEGSEIRISVKLKDEDVRVRIWRIDVGRVPLYLLDTNIPGNSPEAREITAQLYGGDRENRLRQEIILGIGGPRALRALDIHPSAFHMNEGHSAFATLERMRFYIEDKGLAFDEAREIVTATSAFTTHTPVPAGNDIFTADLMKAYFSDFTRSLGIPVETLLDLGRVKPGDTSEDFCMTVLALRLSGRSNGVSQLHSRVSRGMWRGIWPDLPADDLPITGITNGVHIPSWISHEMAELFDRYLGPKWVEDPDSKKVWERIDEIPDTELWRTHERRRERLVAFARGRLEFQLSRRGERRSEVAYTRDVLDPEALTIGFARRFAVYKRATLILRDPERLAGILSSSGRPVQIIVAGKAHPQDQGGKSFIQQFVHIARKEPFRSHIVFLEDYDMNVARYLVQGVDVWLNNPRRPLEACGTSGMKAASNGALNLSIPDGWWVEGYMGDNGWAIGSGEEYDDENYQDEVESRALYDLLEKEIVPLFYERGRDHMPTGWVAMMKNSMRTICPVFNSHRMLEDYMETAYVPAANLAVRMKENDLAGVRELAAWRKRVEKAWPGVKVMEADISSVELTVGMELEARAKVSLGGLSPEDISVEAYYGTMEGDGRFRETATVPLTDGTDEENGIHIFSGRIPCKRTGNFGLSIRILPRHPLLIDPMKTGLIAWG